MKDKGWVMHIPSIICHLTFVIADRATGTAGAQDKWKM